MLDLISDSPTKQTRRKWIYVKSAFSLAADEETGSGYYIRSERKLELAKCLY